jgi:hypothetical protein
MNRCFYHKAETVNFFCILNLMLHVVNSRVEMTHEKLDPQISYRFTLDWVTAERQFWCIVELKMTTIYMFDSMGAVEHCGYVVIGTLPSNKPMLLWETNCIILGSQYLFNYVERFTWLLLPQVCVCVCAPTLFARTRAYCIYLPCLSVSSSRNAQLPHGIPCHARL